MSKPNPINREVVWDKSQTIMSKTDAEGTIVYANQTFSDVCGYSQEELLGSPHNIIRHPDMPKIIFKVLWENIQQGYNFHAVVKNLAKSGEYYWVITDFDIIRDSKGEIVNYLARRTALPNGFVEEKIEPLYKKLLDIENATGSMQNSQEYLQDFLKQNGYLDYLDYVEKSLTEYS